ncbi:hypothetical protein [Bradyrhizobium sp. ARR65]|uniref:hypothetical protein n=1 Tax=Bradyrhizobium sp. ARR65 TaxID=1040989 RepID=UPI000B30804D|nr:hypothetical protein [Bradyrhizobium sp. ARR65]
MQVRETIPIRHAETLQMQLLSGAQYRAFEGNSTHRLVNGISLCLRLVQLPLVMVNEQ